MNSLPATGWRFLLALVAGCLVSWAGTSGALAATSGQDTNEIRIVEIVGTVGILRAPATVWVYTTTADQPPLNPGDRVRTLADSRVVLRWSTESVVSHNELTEIEIRPPHTTGAQFGLQLIKGIISFFHRDKPGRIRVITSGTVAGVEGTEFVIAVDTVNNVERTTLSMIDGKVQLTNPQGALLVTNGQQAIVDVGQAPVLNPAGFIANNVLQWAFYYPAVLDLRDLPLTPQEQQALGESLVAYRAGDLLDALAKYPAGRQPGSDAERVYYAALLLSVGQVEKAEPALAALPAADPSDRLPRLAFALRQLIAAVKRQENPSTLDPQLPTEFLAASYYEQSRAVGDPSLRAALGMAWRAAIDSSDFSFAWARVAELEFSFGYTSRALDALNKGLALAPRNAEALALKGFLLAAQNKTREATEWFNQAIAVDSALGKTWLGRGLSRIRRGDTVGGREDLLVAAALEPQRAALRSYLGKAYADKGDTARATKELQLAKNLDPNDPTEWLYRALLNQQNNRINEAIREDRKSTRLNSSHLGISYAVFCLKKKKGPMLHLGREVRGHQHGCTLPLTPPSRDYGNEHVVDLQTESGHASVSRATQ